MTKLRVAQQNALKVQKQMISKSKQSNENRIYKSTGYRVISIVHLSERIDLQIKPQCNFITNEFVSSESNLVEMGYATRTSDLLILTVSHGNINTDHINVIKKHMPTTIIAYENNEQRVFCKAVGKMVGNVKITRTVLLNNLLKNMKYETSRLCKNRPFLVANEWHVDGDGMILSGFMKKGLVSDKLIINGQVECLIEYVKTVGNGVIKQGSELNRKMDPEEYEIQKEEENADDDNMSVEEYSGSDDVQYTDLIKMCEGYQGIKDIETCKFPDSKPTGLKFFKKFSHLENKILKLKSILKTISLLKSRSTRKWISIE